MTPAGTVAAVADGRLRLQLPAQGSAVALLH
jgi:hypothetical protein